MTFHRWISDGGVTCLPCGLHVDDDECEVTTVQTATNHRQPVTAGALAAQITCGPNDVKPHHMIPYIDSIACAYCGLSVDIYTEGGQPATCTGREDA